MVKQPYNTPVRLISERPVMEPLTDKQQKVLDFIEHQLMQGNPPSQRQIAEHFGLAQNAVYQLVGYLRKKGYLIDIGGHRGLRLSEEYLDTAEQTRGIPIIGRVAAGEPALAQENIEGYVRLHNFFGPSEDVFMLRVAGDSMVDEGIIDGDLVVVKPASTIESGKIAVVLLDDEATVKRVFIHRDRIALKPANKAAGYKTRYIKRGSNIHIIGRVIGCLRAIGN